MATCSSPWASFARELCGDVGFIHCIDYSNFGALMASFKYMATLGEGGEGTTYMYASTDQPWNKVAMKESCIYLVDSLGCSSREQLQAKVTAAKELEPLVSALNPGDQLVIPYQIFIIPSDTVPDSFRVVEFMEYAEGVSLTQYARPYYGVGMPEELVQQLILRALPGLLKLHKAGVVHRDIKSCNIQISSDGFLRFLDFGFAQQQGKVQHKKGQTWTHIAPEALSAYMQQNEDLSQPATPAADVYAFFVTMHLLLVGESCHCKFGYDYHSPTAPHLYNLMTQTGNGVFWGLHSVSDWAAELFQNCLCLEPENRWTWDDVVLHCGSKRITQELESCASNPTLYADMQRLLEHCRALESTHSPVRTVRPPATATNPASSDLALAAALLLQLAAGDATLHLDLSTCASMQSVTESAPCATSPTTLNSNHVALPAASKEPRGLGWDSSDTTLVLGSTAWAAELQVCTSGENTSGFCTFPIPDQACQLADQPFIPSYEACSCSSSAAEITLDSAAACSDSQSRTPESPQPDNSPAQLADAGEFLSCSPQPPVSPIAVQLASQVVHLQCPLPAAADTHRPASEHQASHTASAVIAAAPLPLACLAPSAGRDASAAGLAALILSSPGAHSSGLSDCDTEGNSTEVASELHTSDGWESDTSNWESGTAGEQQNPGLILQPCQSAQSLLQPTLAHDLPARVCACPQPPIATSSACRTAPLPHHPHSKTKSWQVLADDTSCTPKLQQVSQIAGQANCDKSASRRHSNRRPSHKATEHRRRGTQQQATKICCHVQLADRVTFESLMPLALAAVAKALRDL